MFYMSFNQIYSSGSNIECATFLCQSYRFGIYSIEDIKQVSSQMICLSRFKVAAYRSMMNKAPTSSSHLEWFHFEEATDDEVYENPTDVKAYIGAVSTGNNNPTTSGRSDYWRIKEQEGLLIRVHKRPRREYFRPDSSWVKDLPIPLDQLKDVRTTKLTKLGQQSIETLSSENWRTSTDKYPTEDKWTGESIFKFDPTTTTPVYPASSGAVQPPPGLGGTIDPPPGLSATSGAAPSTSAQPASASGQSASTGRLRIREKTPPPTTSRSRSTMFGGPSTIDPEILRRRQEQDKAQPGESSNDYWEK